jgi:hypothetical protein
VKLVLSPVEPGKRRIMVDGQQVGIALTEWDERDHWNGAWRAYLWPSPGVSDAGWQDVTGKFLRLRELRAELERRLAETGPWWQ